MADPDSLVETVGEGRQVLPAVVPGLNLLGLLPTLPAGVPMTCRPAGLLPLALGNTGKGGSNCGVTPVQGLPFLLAVVRIPVGLDGVVAEQRTAEPPIDRSTSLFPAVDYLAPTLSHRAVTEPLWPSDLVLGRGYVNSISDPFVRRVESLMMPAHPIRQTHILSNSSRSK